MVMFFICVHARGLRAGNRGVYHYVHRHSGRIHYVGATNNFNRRHKEHQTARHYYTDSTKYKLKRFSMPHSTHQEIFKKEKEMIRHTNPVANKHPGGNGRREF